MIEKYKKTYSLNILLNYVFVLGAYLGLYTFVSVMSNNTVVVPAVSFTFFSYLLLLLHIKKINGKIPLFITAFVVVALVTIVFTTAPQGYWSKIRGLLLFVYSLLAAYGFYLGIAASSRRYIVCLTFILMIFVILGSFFESVLGFSGLSNAYRDFFFHAEAYSADQRDIDFVGRIRPKLFTSEPSYVAGFFVLISLQWLILAKVKYRLFIYLLLTFSASFLIGSPITILGLLGALVVEVLLYKGRGKTISFSLRKVVVALFLFVAILLIAGSILSSRITSIVHNEEGSFVIRVIVPIYMTYLILSDSPAFGAGLSGSEQQMDQLVEGAALANIPGRDPDEIDRNQNTFFALWMYFGLLGGAIFILIMHNLLAYSSENNRLLLWGLLLMLTQMGLGDIHGIKFWAYLFSILAVFVLVERLRLSDLKAVSAHR